MAQITIYLPDDVEAEAKSAARQKGQSVSRWIADQVIRTTEGLWSKDVLDAAGSIPDFPSLSEIRANYGLDIPRETVG